MYYKDIAKTLPHNPGQNIGDTPFCNYTKVTSPVPHRSMLFCALGISRRFNIVLGVRGGQLREIKLWFLVRNVVVGQNN